LVVSNPSLKSLVIQGYLQGKSRDQIAKELGISIGKVSNIIKDWKYAIGIPIAEEIRDFAILVKKSDISIEQCAEGYRMENLMENLGITNYIDDEDVVDANSNIKSNSNRRIHYNEFSSFVKEIYMNCKNYGIKPDIIFSWIKDLFFYLSPSDNFGSSFINKQKFEVGREEDKPGAFNIKTPAPFLRETESRPVSNLDNTIINSNSNVTINNITSDLNTKQNGGGSLDHQVLFISHISNYIAKKKKECIELENYSKKLEKDGKIVESKKNQMEFELELLKQDEIYVMTFIDWFYDLKRELWERYYIKIEDFEKFTSVINDFKINEFDIAKIMEKYITAISLDDKIKKENAEIQILYNQKLELNKSVALWQDQVN
jgi:predicted transcriptional regulator